VTDTIDSLLEQATVRLLRQIGQGDIDLAIKASEALRNMLGVYVLAETVERSLTRSKKPAVKLAPAE
jgi:hypothetical protein